MPVMNQVLGSNQASPKKNGHPARATAKDAALKKRENRPGKSVRGTVESTTVR